MNDERRAELVAILVEVAGKLRDAAEELVAIAEKERERTEAPSA